METIRKIKKEIAGVFVPPKKKYYFGKLYFGAPYFYPYGYCSSVIKVRKNKYTYKPSNFFKILGYYVYYGSPVVYKKIGLGWKDKFNTPRHEWDPAFYLYFFGLQFCIFWGAPNKDDDHNVYWEMILWYLHYSDKDIEKAKNTWGWVDYNTKESTWNDNFLI